ncbi:hypothetical protein ABIF50_009005 [Bradyrhizobium diazoefficiens]
MVAQHDGAALQAKGANEWGSGMIPKHHRNNQNAEL